jgi:hypothetical protein
MFEDLYLYLGLGWAVGAVLTAAYLHFATEKKGLSVSEGLIAGITVGLLALGWPLALFLLVCLWWLGAFEDGDTRRDV